MKNMTKFILEFALVMFLAVFTFSKSRLLGNILLTIYFAYKVYTMRYFIYSMKGNRLYANNQTKEALIWFEKASKVKSCRPRIITGYGYLLLKEGNIEKSEEIINKVLNLPLDPPDKMNTKMTLALIQWKKGKLDEAIETLEEVYKFYKNSTLYESLGYMLILKGDYEKALKFNLEAYDYNNSSDVILDNLAECYYFLENYEKSAEIYEKLVEKNVYFPEPYYFYGLIFKHQNEKEKALQMLNKALSCRESFLSNLKRPMIQKEIDEINF